MRNICIIFVAIFMSLFFVATLSASEINGEDFGICVYDEVKAVCNELVLYLNINYDDVLDDNLSSYPYAEDLISLLNMRGCTTIDFNYKLRLLRVKVANDSEIESIMNEFISLKIVNDVFYNELNYFK